MASVANSTFGQLPSVQRSRSYKSIFFSVRTGFRYNPNNYERALDAQDESTRLIASIGYIPQKSTISVPHHKPGGLGQFLIFPKAEEKVRETLDLAKKEGIQVFIATGPFWDGTLRVPETLTYMESLHNWLAEIAAALLGQRNQGCVHGLDLAWVEFGRGSSSSAGGRDWETHGGE